VNSMPVLGFFDGLRKQNFLRNESKTLFTVLRNEKIDLLGSVVSQHGSH
jgi:hypothetical protein